MYDVNKSIILFDGVCNICNSSVNYILKRDTKKQFLFASLQSDAAKKLLLQFDIKITKNNWNTILLIHKKQVFTKSTAVLYILKNLPFPNKLMFIFILLPNCIRDYIYTIIAKNRYKWFGKKNTCRIPSKEDLNRFLV